MHASKASKSSLAHYLKHHTSLEEVASRGMYVATIFLNRQGVPDLVSLPLAALIFLLPRPSVFRCFSRFNLFLRQYFLYNATLLKLITRHQVAAAAVTIKGVRRL